MGHPKGSGTGACQHALRDPAVAGPSDGAQDRPTLPSGGWGTLTLCGICASTLCGIRYGHNRKDKQGVAL